MAFEAAGEEGNVYLYTEAVIVLGGSQVHVFTGAMAALLIGLCDISLAVELLVISVAFQLCPLGISQVRMTCRYLILLQVLLPMISCRWLFVPHSLHVHAVLRSSGVCSMVPAFRLMASRFLRVSPR